MILDRLAALGVRRSSAPATRRSGFIARELVRGARGVGRLAALAGDLAHELAVHRGEAARALGLRRGLDGLGRRVGRQVAAVVGFWVGGPDPVFLIDAALERIVAGLDDVRSRLR